MKRSWITKQEAFYDLQGVRKADNITTFHFETTFGPCNAKASLKNAHRGPLGVWSASNVASENLNGSCEGRVSFPLSQSLVLK